MSDIFICGEAWGTEEAEAHMPFVGPSGKLLTAMLAQAGIDRRDCYLSNVFNFQPQPKNDIENLCGPKATALPGYPPIKPGKYIRAEYSSELLRLYTEIQNEAPTLILALGATAAWALLASSGIKKIRGAPAVLSGQALAAVARPIKVFPTYHPAAVMREWSLRFIVAADLEKARRESAFPELIRPHREIWIEPSLADLAVFERDYIDPAPDLSIDIETSGRQITCIGFAPSSDRALVVPFVDRLQRDGNYWRTKFDELKAWEFVRRWCALDKSIVGQNMLFDMNFLWTEYGITIPHATDDTMLLHHSLQPEMEKGLGFMATLYTDELPWKFMRKMNETAKLEDN